MKHLKNNMSEKSKRLLQLSTEKDVSNWLTLVNHNPTIFSVPPGTEKLSKFPRQTKSHDNCNMFHMFNSKIYTDFRTVYNHVLIPSYVIEVIQQNQNIAKH